MNQFLGLLKPCYLRAPRVLWRRLRLAVRPPPERIQTIRLPWGAAFEVNLAETIGREIYKQNLFDLAVAESLWRLTNPGDQCLDIGANIGYMTSLLAARAGAGGLVHSFEPHPQVLASLRRNVAHSAQRPLSARVGLHPCALGDVAGTAWLAETGHFASNQGTAVLLPNQGQEPPTATRSHRVEVRTLDEEFPHESFAVAKLDVEGHELPVLQGARQLLLQKRLRHIIYEANEQAQSPVHPWLQGFGYTVYSLGYRFRGPFIQAGTSLGSIDPGWESPSYLATIAPEQALAVFAPRGWDVIRGR